MYVYIGIHISKVQRTLYFKFKNQLLKHSCMVSMILPYHLAWHKVLCLVLALYYTRHILVRLYGRSLDLYKRFVHQTIGCAVMQ